VSDLDDDIDTPPDHARRNAAIGITMFSLAAAGAWYTNERVDAERRARELQRAANAWSDLSRCLAGEHPRVGTIARTARRAELRVPAGTRMLPEGERMRAWPWRCASYANVLTHALFASHSDDPRHRLLNQFASRAATALAVGALHTRRDDAGSYLDELFAAADRAGLPQGRVSAVALPPEPMHTLDAARTAALFRGAHAGVLAAEEPLDSGALRVLLGTPTRRFCDFDRDLDAPVCQRVAALDASASVRLAAAQYPRMPGYLHAAAAGPSALLHPARSEGAPMMTAVLDAWRDTHDTWLSLRAINGGYVLTRASSMLVLPAHLYEAAPPRQVGPMVVGFARATVAPPTTPDAGMAPRRLRVLTVMTSANGGALTVHDAGDEVTTSSEPRVRACAFGERYALVVWGDDTRALVHWWDRDHWLQTQAVEAGHGMLSCDEGRVRVAWWSATPVPMVHVTTCAPEGCRHASAPAPFTDTPPRIAALGDRVLMVYTGEEGAGLRYRYGALATLAEGRETVVFDDAAHEGVDFEMPPTLLTRGATAVVLATRAQGAHETWAVRIDAQGYRSVAPRP
jgi:hypothetical protein